MSWEALAWAKQQRGLGPQGKLLLILLAEKAGSTHSCWPSIARLADELEASERTVQRLLARFELEGLITRTVRYRKTSLYTLQMKSIYVTPVDDTDVDETDDGSEDKGDSVTPMPPRVTNLAPKGDREAPSRVTPRLSPEHHLVTKDKNNPPTPHGPTFEDFWTAYEKKSGKATAKKKWDLAIKQGADPHHLVAAASRYASCFGEGKKDRQYQKHPATWLHQGCYDDEYLPTPSQLPVRRYGGYQPQVYTSSTGVQIER